MPEEASLPGLRAVLELTRDAVVIFSAADEQSPAPRLVDANGGFLDLFGYAREEVVGRGLRLLRGPHTEVSAFARLQAALEERRPIDVTMTASRADGGVVWAEIRGRPLDESHYVLLVQDATARREAEAAVRHVAEHFQALTDLTSDYVYVLRVGPDSRLTLEWTAGAFTRVTGYSTEDVEALGGWIELIEPEDQRAVQRRNQRLLAGESATVEYRIRTRTGERRWLHDGGRPQWTEDGQLVERLLCAARDVTDTRRLERLVRLREGERRALAGATDAIVCALDAEGRIADILAEQRLPLGERLQDAIGQPLSAVLGDEAAWPWLSRIDRVVLEGKPARFGFSHTVEAEEQQFDVSLSPAPPEGVIAVIRPRPTPVPGLAEQALPFHFDPVLDAVDTVVLRLSPDLVVRDVNTTAMRLSGWGRDELVGRPFVEVLLAAEERKQMLKHLGAAKRGNRVEDRSGNLRLSDGSLRPMRWSLVPISDGTGRVTDIVVSAQEAVAAADAEQVLREGQQRLNAILDHIADGVITIDPEGLVESFSRSAETIFDYGREEVIGRSIERLITQAPGPGPGVMARLVEASKQPREIEEMLGRRRSGEVVPIELAVKEVELNGQRTFILTVRDITLRKQTEETIRHLAYHDPLTGLPNRLLFHDRLSQAVERARRNRQQLTVMLLDLDRFKLINDSLGLEQGDQVLRAVAERLVATVRRSDTVARLGGDEFLLLLPGTEGAEVAAKVAQKVLDSLKPLLVVNGHELNVTASVGIALYPHDGETPEVLIKNADTALYRAKEQGRSVYQFYTTDMNAAAFERLVLETQLRKALERGELVVYYQPQLRLDTGAVVGVEALVRWFHPDLGMIPPGDFIPLAEETGLILAIGQWVLRTACTQVQRWHRLGFSDLRLAVNLSARQFQRADLVQTVARQLEETGFPAEQLELELTESVIMREAEETIERLRALDELGIRLAVDDFGTGYSSLSYLKRLPIRSLKIDRSFIQDITTDANDAAIAQAIIALAESLNLKVIAEGVETEEQLELLRAHRCQEMQGFLFSRPLPADELLALLREGRRLPT